MAEPDMRQYAQALQAMLRQRSPVAYRAFLKTWSDIHERGVAERLAKQDDATLRTRIERMIIDLPELADLHDLAREHLAASGGNRRGGI